MTNLAGDKIVDDNSSDISNYEQATLIIFIEPPSNDQQAIQIKAIPHKYVYTTTASIIPNVMRFALYPK